MLRRSFAVLLAGLSLIVMLGCGDSAAHKSDGGGDGPHGPLGGPLFVVEVPKNVELPEAKGASASSLIVVESARIVIIDKQDVPSQRDGVVLKLLVKEGQVVQENQPLAQLDERLASADVLIKDAKVKASVADEDASKKTRDESHNRYLTQLDLWRKKATSEEEVRAAKLTEDRYVAEALSKGQAIELAKQELEQARVVRDMHQIRSTVAGEVKVIYKRPGESVKNLEPVFQLINTDRVRIEGLVDEQHRRDMVRQKDHEVDVEPTMTESPRETFRGHLQEVTGVAVSAPVDLGKGEKVPLIVSCSEDGTIRLWKRGSEEEVTILRHTTPVRAIACTPKGSAENLCLSGAADGKGRLWDLNTRSEKVLRELKESHRGAITCVAFTPDGKSCATGGEDREIRVWNTATGELRYKLPAGHRGAITSLAFTQTAMGEKKERHSLLVSAGRDNTLRVWDVREHGAEQRDSYDRRSGDVTAPGVSPDGRHLLYDQGKTLRLLTLDGGRNVGEIKNPSGASNFTTFAQFSPDSQLILTAGASDGQLQLWRAPGPNRRGSELRQFVVGDRSPATCAAFEPGEQFVVTGAKDRRVYLWGMPEKKEYDTRDKDYKKLTAKITYVESVVETAGRQIRVWAELNNPRDEDGKPRLVPGGTATIVIDPTKK